MHFSFVHSPDNRSSFSLATLFLGCRGIAFIRGFHEFVQHENS